VFRCENTSIRPRVWAGSRSLRKAGDIGGAIKIALDIEQLTHEVNTFLNAASLMNRISRQ
jgi:hypothetical protein